MSYWRARHETNHQIQWQTPLVLLFMLLVLLMILLGRRAYADDFSQRFYFDSVAEAKQLKPNPAPVIKSPSSRFAWAGLGQNKTIALGELLKKTKFSRKVVIWCATVDCTDLAADFDDAFQIAGVEDDIDRRELDSSADVGIFIGPFSEDSEKLLKAIELTTGLKPKMVTAPEGGALALIIGKKPR